MTSSRFRFTALLAATALTLSACGGSDDSSDSGGGDGGSSEGASDGGGSEGGVIVGIKYDQPGLGVMKDDEPTGLGVDVAKAVVDGLGMSESDITWKEAPTPQREDLLESEQVDMIVATYSITDERKERVQFAGPYFIAGQDLLVSADSDIASVDDLDGKLLCSVTGSTSTDNVKEEVPGVQLQEYSSYSECVSQLANGTIDAVTTDDTILAGYAAQEQYAGKVKLVGNTFSEENYGVGLSKGNDQCEEINEILQGLWDDGTMDTIIEDNLGAADYKPNADLNPPAEIGGNCES